MTRERSLDLLAPIAKAPFEALAKSLAEDSDFVPFETYRDPVEQHIVFETGRSKARPFESPHQYGLAVDFVPFVDGEWRWPEADHPCWDVLALRAKRFGLLCPIKWDRPHVEHPAWTAVRAATRR